MSEIQVDLNGQIVSFWIAVAVGAALCVLYDLFKFVRLLYRSSKTAVFVQDMAWWIITALATYVLLLVRCKGVVRSFVIIGEAVGFAAYRFTVSRVAERPIKKFAAAIRAAVRFVKTKIFAPVAAGFKKMSAKLAQVFKKFTNFFKKHLKQLAQLVYNRHMYGQKHSTK